MRSFLDHIYHPAAIINYLMGPIARASYEWEPRNGANVAALKFASGAVGTLHFAAGQSGTSPLERVEVIGERANAVVDNGVHLKYYRAAKLPAYGRASSFIQEDEAAPIFWEPECSLGQRRHAGLGDDLRRGDHHAGGAHNPLHSHPNCEEILYVGSCEHKLGDETVRLGPGSAIRIPRGVRHWARARPGAAHGGDRVLVGRPARGQSRGGGGGVADA